MFLVFVVLLLISQQCLRHVGLLGLYFDLWHLWLFHYWLLCWWLQRLLNTSSRHCFDLVLFVLDLGIALLLIWLGTRLKVFLCAIVEFLVQVPRWWISVLGVVRSWRCVSRRILLKGNRCVVLPHLRRANWLGFVFEMKLRFRILSWRILLPYYLKRFNFRASWDGSSINTRFYDSD